MQLQLLQLLTLAVLPLYRVVSKISEVSGHKAVRRCRRCIQGADQKENWLTVKEDYFANPYKSCHQCCCYPARMRVLCLFVFIVFLSNNQEKRPKRLLHFNIWHLKLLINVCSVALYSAHLFLFFLLSALTVFCRFFFPDFAASVMETQATEPT